MQSEEKKRIVIAGAHAGTVALALVEEIIKERKNWEIHFIGPKFSFEKSTLPSTEKEYLGKYGIFYHPLVSGKLVKDNPIFLILSLIKTISGLINAIILLIKIKPVGVLSLGGYIGVPVVVGAKLLGISVVLHEQISGMGLANKISVYFSDKVALARSESLKNISRGKAVVTGNPIRNSIFKVRQKTKIGNPPVIFVFTGSRGSRSINKIIDEKLETLLEKYKLMHLTGEIDFNYFEGRRQMLPSELRRRYEVFKFIEPEIVGEFYSRSDIIISRGGANTVSELLVVKRPAVLIPISWSIMNEQYKNALIAENFGIGRIIEEKDLTSDKLLSEINYLHRNWTKMSKTVMNKNSPDIDASQKVLSLIEKVI